jgi:hypothetical protein
MGDERAKTYRSYPEFLYIWGSLSQNTSLPLCASNPWQYIRLRTQLYLCWSLLWFFRSVACPYVFLELSAVQI